MSGHTSIVSGFYLKILIATGAVTSPHHPFNYALEKTETIEVKSGDILRLEFTNFTIYGDPTACDIYDYVEITDGDGTTLMDKSCGDSSRNPSDPIHFLPPVITSRSSRVAIFFNTGGSWTGSGWSLRWSAVTPGHLIIQLGTSNLLRCHHYTTISNSTIRKGWTCKKLSKSWHCQDFFW